MTSGNAPSLRDEAGVLAELEREVGLTEREARFYVRLLREGGVPSDPRPAEIQRLLDEGMAILSGDGGGFKPLHPRLAIANHYRTWREQVVREIGERRMRVDRLILELIPLYEAATEKRLAEGGRQ